jgi:hypothetical protein
VTRAKRAIAHQTKGKSAADRYEMAVSFIAAALATAAQAQRELKTAEVNDGTA